jgi:hypothetical protein
VKGFLLQQCCREIHREDFNMMPQFICPQAHRRAQIAPGAPASGVGYCDNRPVTAREGRLDIACSRSPAEVNRGKVSDPGKRLAIEALLKATPPKCEHPAHALFLLAAAVPRDHLAPDLKMTLAFERTTITHGAP